MSWGGGGRGEGGGEGRGVNGSKFGVGMRLFGSPMNPWKMSHTMFIMCCFGDFVETDTDD